MSISWEKINEEAEIKYQQNKANEAKENIESAKWTSRIILGGLLIFVIVSLILSLVSYLKKTGINNENIYISIYTICNILILVLIIVIIAGCLDKINKKVVIISGILFVIGLVSLISSAIYYIKSTTAEDRVQIKLRAKATIQSAMLSFSVIISSAIAIFSAYYTISYIL